MSPLPQKLKPRALLIFILLSPAACLPLSTKEQIAPRLGGESTFDWIQQANPKKEGEKKKCTELLSSAISLGQLDVRIVFGYKDTRPSRFVGDYFERNALVAQLVKPCAHDSFVACGLARDPDDADRFFKVIELEEQKIKLSLSIVHSSIGPDDQENRQSQAQILQSAYAEKIFYDGLENADAVFYVGHSRDGGGPDFQPPRLLKRNHIDYQSYIDRKEGLKLSLKSLRKRPKEKPVLLALLSCSSSDHFAREVLKFEKLQLISSRVLIYYTDALENTLAGLNSYLIGECPSDFRRALYARSSRSAGIKYEGFLLGDEPKKKP